MSHSVVIATSRTRRGEKLCLGMGDHPTVVDAVHTFRHAGILAIAVDKLRPHFQLKQKATHAFSCLSDANLVAIADASASLSNYIAVVGVAHLKPAVITSMPVW